MSWQDFLYTKGIIEADLTPAQRKTWHALWEKQYGELTVRPPLTSEVNLQPPTTPEVEITPLDDAGEI